ncbi:MAG: hypothetical protein JNM68_12775 [Dinghuibacter sp.]|nr:hypothetical protein [Dinghuibacter sp.]
MNTKLIVMKKNRKKLNLSKLTILKLQKDGEKMLQGGFSAMCPSNISLAPGCNWSRRDVCCA